MELLGRFHLLNRETGARDPAELFMNVGEADIADVERLWHPVLDRRSAEFATWNEAAAGNVQDAHWDWADKAHAVAGSMSHELFAVVSAGQTQGLMVVGTNQFARLDGQQGREMVYVEFVATAPWNRHLSEAPPRYKGVGRLLMGVAIDYSFDQGFHGRVGLHSLEESESWYRERFPFNDLGFDAAKRMRYFEMSEANAATFISAAKGTES